ncbi:hypothetical protein [Paenibacillus turpanensis]|uniref:hypothetical protein n=1 Tax=Paenibacillus turpanensis TaxID=2689078 RepID=UPI001408588A
MKDTKHIVYMGLLLGMLIYAVPRLEMGGGWTLPTVFGIVWIGMALLLLSANLYQVLKVDEETAKEYRRIRQYRRWQAEQSLRKKLQG